MFLTVLQSFLFCFTSAFHCFLNLVSNKFYVKISFDQKYSHFFNKLKEIYVFFFYVLEKKVNYCFKRMFIWNNEFILKKNKNNISTKLETVEYNINLKKIMCCMKLFFLHLSNLLVLQKVYCQRSKIKDVIFGISSETII